MESPRKRCLDIANALITRIRLPVSQISSLEDINSDFIIYLSESIIHQNIPDLLVCQSKEDEAHNVQTLIDFLSLDLLGISLSHLTGEDIVSGKTTSLMCLFEVLEAVSEHLPKSKSRLQGNVLKRKICKRKTRRHSTNINTCDEKTPTDSNNKEVSHEVCNESKGLRSAKTRRTLETARSCTTSPPHKLARTQSSFVKKEHFKKETLLKVPDACDKTLSTTQSTKVSMPKSHFSSQNKENILKRKTRNISKNRVSKSFNSPTRKDVEEMLEDNLKRKLKVIMRKENSVSPRANRMKILQIQSIKKPSGKSPVAACKKSFLLPHTLRRRGVSSKVSSKKSRLQMTTKKDPTPSKGCVQDLLEAFPDVQLPRPLLDQIRKRYERHLWTLHRKLVACLEKKPRVQAQAEEALHKQATLSRILEKDIKTQKHLDDLKDKQRISSQIKFGLRDARLRSAKMRHYCDEFRQQMAKRTSKRNYTKEKIFERAFEGAMCVQRDQVDELCRGLREADNSDARQHSLYLESLHNLYESQTCLLRKTLLTEQSEVELRTAADKEALRCLERTFRTELANEIRFMQDVIVDCLVKDTHYTEMAEHLASGTSI